ncbi:MAG: hypothetical protein K0S33_3357 [Bacteroidetes bacterium]|jgi:hypothetical protein|nr:hypothetical protein [Bacteroidota bacterium]
MRDFTISARAPVSSAFREKNIHTFAQACDHIRTLPYKRNENKENGLCVLTDGFGTCSTKHAILRLLAIENNVPEIKLILGVIKMNGANTPAIATILDKYGLEHIPEAHNYLSVNGKVIDCTKENFGLMNAADLIAEIEIAPDQITGFKVSYHQQVLKQWLTEHPEIQFPFEEIWQIREECIAGLSY